MSSPDYTGTTPEVCARCHGPKDAPRLLPDELDSINASGYLCDDPFHATPATLEPPSAPSGEMHGQHIEAEAIGRSASGKTGVYEVRSKSQGSVLGYIRWYGPWRQYVFFPEFDTLYSAGCMDDLARFCKEAKAR